MQARTANGVLKAQERKLRLAKLKGELVERDRAKALVFRLAREERDAWVTWPARVATMMAAELAAGERAVTAAMREAGSGLKTAWRDQMTGAGLGQRLARTIRS